MSKTVWMATAPRDRDIYHTNKDCTRLQSRRPVELESLRGDFRECKICSGEYEAKGGPSEIYTQLAYE